MTTSLSTEISERILNTAYALARTNHLVTGEEIRCWSCSRRRALMPSLHCAQCLAESHRRAGRLEPLCVNREQTPADVEACRSSGPVLKRPPSLPPPVFVEQSHPERGDEDVPF